MAWIEVHQGLREHRKTYACAEKLKISRVVMVGTLVSLWLWALDNAPDGSMDGISNRTIAHVCDWPEKKAETLINSLVECGWLDKDGDILRIHDWTDYAGRLMERRENDKARKKKSREKQRMSEGCPQDVHGKSCATVPIPYPTVPNLNVSANNTDSLLGRDSGQTPETEDDSFFAMFWESYPNKIDQDEALEKWKALNPDADTVQAIMAGLEAWKRSSQWIDDGPRYIPSAANWLNKRRWESEPPPSAKKEIPKGASGVLGKAEMEAIRMILGNG